MVTLLTLKQEVQGFKSQCRPTKVWSPYPSLLPRLQVAKMCQGSLKGMVYVKAEHPGWQKKIVKCKVVRSKNKESIHTHKFLGFFKKVFLILSIGKCSEVPWTRMNPPPPRKPKLTNKKWANSPPSSYNLRIYCIPVGSFVTHVLERGALNACHCGLQDGRSAILSHKKIGEEEEPFRKKAEKLFLLHSLIPESVIYFSSPSIS